MSRAPLVGIVHVSGSVPAIFPATLSFSTSFINNTPDILQNRASTARVWKWRNISITRTQQIDTALSAMLSIKSGIKEVSRWPGRYCMRAMDVRGAVSK
jgi:hypothetical protein